MDKVRFSPELKQGMAWDAYVEKMDRAGIRLSLINATRAGDLRVKYSYAIPYERVAAVCEEYPGRFLGLAGIDPSRGMEGLREFERGINEFGFIGAHLYPHWFGWAPDDRHYYPFYAKCCELDVPIMMQMGHCLDYQRDRILLSVGQPITLDRVAADFPELKLIGIHLGWPWTEELIAMCYKHANVYMAGDAYAPKHWPATFVRYIDSWGQDKVMFGTDWPVIDTERAVKEVDELGLRPEPRRKLLWKNAERVFKLDAGSEGAELDRRGEVVAQKLVGESL
jgi:predicted TIM-barrel fold metal-dependent hydrolase